MSICVVRLTTVCKKCNESIDLYVTEPQLKRLLKMIHKSDGPEIHAPLTELWE